MPDHEATRHVGAPAEAVFDFVREVHNLPRYFSRMVSAEPGNGEEVVTRAQLPDGRTVEGAAWFRVEPDASRIEWGSEGPNDYHGSLDVAAADEGSDVTVKVHTNRAGGSEIDDALAETLAALARACEER